MPTDRTRPPYARLLVAGLGGIALGAGVVTMTHRAQTEREAALRRRMDAEQLASAMASAMAEARRAEAVEGERLAELEKTKAALRLQTAALRKRVNEERLAEARRRTELEAQYAAVKEKQDLSEHMQRAEVEDKAALRLQTAALRKRVNEAEARRRAELEAQYAAVEEERRAEARRRAELEAALRLQTAALRKRMNEERRAEARRHAELEAQYAAVQEDQDLSERMRRAEVEDKAALRTQLESATRRLAEANDALLRARADERKRHDEWQAEHTRQLAELQRENERLRKEAQRLKNQIVLARVQDHINDPPR